jgi:hypothetical protein
MPSMKFSFAAILFLVKDYTALVLGFSLVISITIYSCFSRLYDSEFLCGAQPLFFHLPLRFS